MSTAAVRLRFAAIAAAEPSERERTSERWLRGLIEVPAALVLVAEIVILFVGIVARAVFNNPIIWSDELASILFLWLGMLGTAIAVQRGAHMRLSFFVSVLSPRARQWIETLGVGAVGLFFAIVLQPALDYMQDQGFVETPALGWSGTVRALAMPAGSATGASGN